MAHSIAPSSCVRVCMRVCSCVRAGVPHTTKIRVCRRVRATALSVSRSIYLSNKQTLYLSITDRFVDGVEIERLERASEREGALRNDGAQRGRDERDAYTHTKCEKLLEYGSSLRRRSTPLSGDE